MDDAGENVSSEEVGPERVRSARAEVALFEGAIDRGDPEHDGPEQRSQARQHDQADTGHSRWPTNKVTDHDPTLSDEIRGSAHAQTTSKMVPTAR